MATRKTKKRPSGIAENDTQLVVRLPQKIVDHIEAYSAWMRSENPGLRVTKSESARAIIMLGLTTLKEKAPFCFKGVKR